MTNETQEKLKNFDSFRDWLIQQIDRAVEKKVRLVSDFWGSSPEEIAQFQRGEKDLQCCALNAAYVVNSDQFDFLIEDVFTMSDFLYRCGFDLEDGDVRAFICGFDDDLIWIKVTRARLGKPDKSNLLARYEKLFQIGQEIREKYHVQ